MWSSTIEKRRGRLLCEIAAGTNYQTLGRVSVEEICGLAFIPQTGDFSVHGDTGMIADVRALLQEGFVVLSRSQSGRLDELAITPRGLMAVAELERPWWKQTEKYFGGIVRRAGSQLTGQGLKKPEVVK
jgi:hypothetical protein